MDRKFFSNKARCKSNCKYCFEKWNGYDHFETFSMGKADDEPLIVYPNCDGNFFDEEFENNIKELLSCKQKLVVSISTKNKVTDIQLERILEVDKYLKSINLGFVKISVSFSCVESIEELEKGTLSYNGRLKLIESLTESGLKYATIIKPILPFISFKEYKRLIDDTLQFSNNFIIGDLYVNCDTDFYRDYIKNKFVLVEKKATWSKGSQIWSCIEDRNLHNQIHDYIIAKQGCVFESDLDFIMSITV